MQSLPVLAQINALLTAKLFGEPVDHALVEVITAQMGVARRGFDFEDAFTHFKNRHIKRAATKVEDQHGFTGFFVQAIGQRRCRGLVDDAQHIQACNLARISCSGTLGIIEIGRHSNDRIGDFLPQVFGGVLYQLAQHHGGNLFRGILFALDVKAHGVIGSSDDFEGHILELVLHLIVAAANEPYRRIDSAVGIEDRLASGQLAHQALSRFGKPDHRRGQAVAFAVDNHRRLAAFHHGDHRIRRAKVDAYCLCHISPHYVNASYCSWRDLACLPIVKRSQVVTSLCMSPHPRSATYALH